MAEYVHGTNILQTRFRTRTGVLQITDFMPVSEGHQRELHEQHELYRRVEVLKGNVITRVSFEPRFDYARSYVLLEKQDASIKATGNKEIIFLAGTHDLLIEDNRVLTEWNLSEGDKAWLHLIYGEDRLDELNTEKAEKSLSDYSGSNKKELVELLDFVVKRSL